MTIKKARVRADVEALVCTSVESKPVTVDWASRIGENLDGWASWEAEQCDGCNALVVMKCGDADGPHNEIDGEDCTGSVPSSEGPMMNYFYPIGGVTFNAPASQWAMLVGHLPVCVVELDDQIGLALTGGGMDLSWEICAAYIALGHLPPVHFCSLPDISGRGTSEGDRVIVAACQRSLAVVGGWLASRSSDLDGLLKRAARDARAKKAR